MRSELIMNFDNRVQYLRHRFMWYDKKSIPLSYPGCVRDSFSNDDIAFMFDIKNRPIKKVRNCTTHFRELYYLKYYEPTNINIKLNTTRPEILDYLEYLNWEK